MTIHSMSKNLPAPHPDDVAARKALAKLPPLSLEQVLVQAKASAKHRLRALSNGQKKQGD